MDTLEEIDTSFIEYGRAILSNSGTANRNWAAEQDMAKEFSAGADTNFVVTSALAVMGS